MQITLSHKIIKEAFPFLFPGFGGKTARVSTYNIFTFERLVKKNAQRIAEGLMRMGYKVDKQYYRGRDQKVIVTPIELTGYDKHKNPLYKIAWSILYF